MDQDDTRMLRGSSGQRLAVQFSGDLDGRPALFFHGTPGSRLFIPPEEVSQQAHAWVVTVDRPGYGLSDAVPPDGTIAAVAQDILSVVTEEVGAPLAVVGFSGGAPYALACGALAPDVVTGVAVVSGDAPPRLPPEPSELSASEIELVQRIRRDPSSGANPLRRHAQAFANDPLVYMTKPVVGADAAIRARPEVRALLERTAREPTAGRERPAWSWTGCSSSCRGASSSARSSDRSPSGMGRTIQGLRPVQRYDCSARSRIPWFILSKAVGTNSS